MLLLYQMSTLLAYQDCLSYQHIKSVYVVTISDVYFVSISKLSELLSQNINSQHKLSMLLLHQSVYVVIIWCLCYYNSEKCLSILLLHLECLCCQHINVSFLLSHIVYVVITHGKMCLSCYHIKSVYVIITWCLCYYNSGKSLSIFLLYLECLSCQHINVSFLLSHSVYVIITQCKNCLAYYNKKKSMLLSYPECLRYYGSPFFQKNFWLKSLVLVSTISGQMWTQI